MKQTFADSILETVMNDEKEMAIIEMLDRFGLNWEVVKQRLSLPDGTETPYFGIAREDNKTCFSTCKDSYVPYQNQALAELVYQISEKTGYTLHNGGMFNG